MHALFFCHETAFLNYASCTLFGLQLAAGRLPTAYHLDPSSMENPEEMAEVRIRTHSFVSVLFSYRVSPRLPRLTLLYAVWHAVACVGALSTNS